MKTYDETIASVFAKGDAILERRKIRALRIKRISLAASGLCAAAIVGFSVLHNNAAREAVNHEHDIPGIISETDNVSTVTTAADEDEISVTTKKTHTKTEHTTLSSAALTTAVTTSVREGSSATGKTKGTAKVDTVTKSAAVSAHNGGYSITTTTGAATTVPEDERSLEMKKITAFAAAFMMSFTALPLTANANDNYKLYTFDNADDRAVIAVIADGKKDIDLDSNGKFDINDVYQYYLYCDGYVVDDAVKKKAEELGDLDGFTDNDIRYFDSTILMKYYIMSNPLDTSIFNIDNYEPASHTPETLKWMEDHGIEPDPSYTSAKYFALNLTVQMKYNGTGYGFMKEMVDNGEISLDVNGDGAFDVKDIVDYEIFIENLLDNDISLYNRYYNTLIKDKVDWNVDDMFYAGETPPIYDSEYPCPFDIIDLPESTVESCAAVFSKIAEYGGKQSGRYMAYCYLQDNTLNDEYFTKEYFEQFYKGASNYGINDTFIFAARTGDNIEYSSTFDKNKFQEDFKNYCKDVEDGKKPVPDMNGDGKVNSEDYSDAMTYLNRTFFPVVGETEEEFDENMPLPKKVWDNFTNNCDLDGNGKSGEFYDIVMLQCYTLLADDETFNKSATETINISKEFKSNFALLDAIDIERSGDANLDGNTDISDAVLIMQTNSNPAKYDMSNKGKFNADIYETGDGVTTKDAQQIQKQLLGLE